MAEVINPYPERPHRFGSAVFLIFTSPLIHAPIMSIALGSLKTLVCVMLVLVLAVKGRANEGTLMGRSDSALGSTQAHTRVDAQLGDVTRSQQKWLSQSEVSRAAALQNKATSKYSFQGFSLEAGINTGASAQAIHNPFPFGATGFMTSRGNGWSTSLGIFWTKTKANDNSRWKSRLGLDVSYAQMKGSARLFDYSDGLGGLAEISRKRNFALLTEPYEGNIPNENQYRTYKVANKADYLAEGSIQAATVGVNYQLSYQLFSGVEFLVNLKGGTGFLYIDNCYSYTDLSDNRRIIHVYKAPMLLTSGTATAGLKLFKYLSVQAGPSAGLASNFFGSSAVFTSWNSSVGVVVGF